LVLLGRFWQLQGDLGNAHQYLDDAVVTYQGIGMLYEQMETVLLQGEVFLQAGYHQAAQEKLRTALDYFREEGGRDQADRAIAGLARLAFIDERQSEALQLVESLLPRLDQDALPIVVHLTCYQILDSLGDQRAIEILELAQKLLVMRADKIHDVDLRRSYLSEIPSHRHVIEEVNSKGLDQLIQ